MNIIKRGILATSLLALLFQAACGVVPQQRKEEIKEEAPIVQTVSPTKTATVTPMPTATHTLTPTATFTNTPTPDPISKYKLRALFFDIDDNPVIEIEDEYGNTIPIKFIKDEEPTIYNGFRPRTFRIGYPSSYNVVLENDGSISERLYLSTMNLYIPTQNKFTNYDFNFDVLYSPLKKDIYARLKSNGISEIIKDENIITADDLPSIEETITTEKYILQLFLNVLLSRREFNPDSDTLKRYEMVHDYLKDLETYKNDLVALGLNSDEFENKVAEDIKTSKISESTFSIKIKGNIYTQTQSNLQILLALRYFYLTVESNQIFIKVAEEIKPYAKDMHFVDINNILPSIVSDFSSYEEEASKNFWDKDKCVGSVGYFLEKKDSTDNDLDYIKMMCGEYALGLAIAEFLENTGYTFQRLLKGQCEEYSCRLITNLK